MARFWCVFSLVLALCGCKSEQDAREYLENNGAEVLEVEADDGAFKYRVVRDGRRCTGRLELSGGPFSTNASTSEMCGVPASVDELQQECEAERYVSCSELGLQLIDADPDQALVFLQAGCRGGIVGACVNAGVVFANQTPPGSHEAIRLAQLGCDGNDGVGCGNLGGYLFTNGLLETPDLPRAVVALSKACDLGRTDRCRQLGWEFAFGPNLDRDVTRGHGLLARACEASDMKACAFEAVVFRDGLGVTSSIPRALELARRSCEQASEPLACLVAGELARDQGELEPALGAFGRGCAQDGTDPNIGPSCVEAGMILVRREPPEGPRIIALFERACELNDSAGCNNLGVALRNGLVPPNPVRSQQMFARACELGNQPACANVR